MGGMMMASGIYGLAAVHFFPEKFYKEFSPRKLKWMGIFVIMGGAFVACTHLTFGDS